MAATDTTRTAKNTSTSAETATATKAQQTQKTRGARKGPRKRSAAHNVRHPRRLVPMVKIAPAPPNPLKELLGSSDDDKAKGRLGSMSFDPRITEESNIINKDRQTNSRHLPMLHAARCLLRLGMLDGLRRHDSFNETQHVFYKARVLESVIERLAAERTAVSEATINALVYLVHYELSQGSEDAKIHLQGLQRVASLRSDMETQGTLPFVAPLELGDMIHALIFEAPLEFARHRYPKNDRLLDPPDTTYFIARRSLSDLASEIRILIQTSRARNPKIFEQRLAIATRGTDLTSLVLRSDPAALGGWQPVFDEYESEAEEFLRLAAVEVQHRPADAVYLIQASSYSQLILYSWVVQKRPLGSDRVQAYVEALASTYNKISPAGWERSPFTRIFILLTAISATTSKVLKSQLETQLVQTIVRLGDAEWGKVKGKFMKFPKSFTMRFD